MDILLILVRIIFFTLFLFIITVIGTILYFYCMRQSMDKGDLADLGTMFFMFYAIWYIFLACIWLTIFLFCVAMTAFLISKGHAISAIFFLVLTIFCLQIPYEEIIKPCLEEKNEQ